MQTTFKITGYLVIALNLYNGTVSPFRKYNQYPCYINVVSNHPRQIFKHILPGVRFILSTDSTNILIFIQNKQDGAEK